MEEEEVILEHPKLYGSLVLTIILTMKCIMKAYNVEGGQPSWISWVGGPLDKMLMEYEKQEEGDTCSNV